MPQKREKKGAFEAKSLVLAKMTGFPAWPSFVMPTSMIPSPIMRAKKKTTNTCVIFIPDGDFYWMNEKSLELLSEDKLTAKLSKLPKDKLKPKPKKKAGRTTNVGDALAAANGLDFDEFMEDLALQNKGFQGKDEDDDEDDEDEGEEGDSISEESKMEDKEEVIEPEKEALDEEEEEEEGDSRSRKRTRGRTNGAPRKRVVTPTNGEATNGHSKAKSDARSSSPKPMSESDRQHQLWLCRIKLQRSLIQRNQPITPKDPTQYPPPTVDDLLVARLILNRLADVPVSVELLRETKIHKVLRCIIKDGDLEYPDSFRLHDKCRELLEKWKSMIEHLKVEKQARFESRMSSQAPEDSEISGIETKKSLEADHAEKLEV